MSIVNDSPSWAEAVGSEYLLEHIIETAVCGEKLANASFVDISRLSPLVEKFSGCKSLEHAQLSRIVGLARADHSHSIRGISH